MTRELQLRDVEILRVFEALALNSASMQALEQEVMKQCDCTTQRIDDAIRRTKENPEHLYWK